MAVFISIKIKRVIRHISFPALLAVLSFFGVAGTARAGIVPCSGLDCTVCDLFVLVKNLIDFILKDLVFPLAVIVLLYGGIMWVVAGGDEGKISKGKNAIKMAVYGIIVAFAAWLLIDTIVKYLVSGNFDFAFGPWNAMPSCTP